MPQSNYSAPKQDNAADEEQAEEDLSEEADGPTASYKVKEMLKAGQADDAISIETGQTVRVVKFIRSQMQARGEI
jgi:hypothetical protein